MDDQKKTLLLMDDSRVALKFFESHFTLYGYQVKTVQSEEQLMSILEICQPNCFIIDYEMDGVTGPEITMKLKNNAKTRHIPIIILTSQTDKKYLLSAINSGADDFVDKKIDPEVIVYKTQAVIRSSELLIKHMELEKFRTTHAMITTYNHEINNPLAVAAGMLGKNLESLTPERFDKAHKALNRIKEVVQKIDELTQTAINFKDYVKSGNKESKMIELRRKIE